METCEVKIEMTVTLKDGESIEKFKPFKAHPGDAAFDLMNAEDYEAIVIPPNGRVLFSAGFKMELPEGWEAQIRPRSGNAIKNGITVLNTPGTIDSGYRGNVGVILYNSNKENPITIHRGDKIAQMVIQRIPEVSLKFVDSVETETERGEAGFGSTGLAGK